MDRCTGDAVAHVTGVKLGRRSLKFADYGIMAATFINLETGQAYRVISTEEARDLARSMRRRSLTNAASNWQPTGSCRTASSSGSRRWKWI